MGRQTLLWNDDCAIKLTSADELQSGGAQCKVEIEKMPVKVSFRINISSAKVLYKVRTNTKVHVPISR